MDRRQCQSNRNSKIIVWEYALTVIILLLLLASMFGFAPKSTKTMYCHFEYNMTDVLPRHECVNMKVISKDIDLVNLNVFNSLNLTENYCTDKYKKLEECSGEYMYFSYNSLKVFQNDVATNESNVTTDKEVRMIDGYVAAEHYVDYHTNNTALIEKYENLVMMEEFDSKEELQERFKLFRGIP